MADSEIGYEGRRQMVRVVMSEDVAIRRANMAEIMESYFWSINRTKSTTASASQQQQEDSKKKWSVFFGRLRTC